jgi:hypothetical protein
VYSCSPQAGLSWKCKHGDDDDTQVSDEKRPNGQAERLKTLNLCLAVCASAAFALVAHWLAMTCAGSVQDDGDDDK